MSGAFEQKYEQAIEEIEVAAHWKDCSGDGVHQLLDDNKTAEMANLFLSEPGLPVAFYPVLAQAMLERHTVGKLRPELRRLAVHCIERKLVSINGALPH